MPFKTKNRLDQNWWGIERKVGQFLGSPKGDVMLVQTLLNAIQQTENGGVFIVWSVPSSRPWTIPPSVVIEEAACPARYTPSHSSINCSHWRSRCGTCSLMWTHELTRSCAPRWPESSYPAETSHVRVNGSNRASVAVEFPWSGPVDTTRP
jgi:hypothetical protein